MRRTFTLQLCERLKATACWDGSEPEIGPLDCVGPEPDTTTMPGFKLCRRCARERLQQRAKQDSDTAVTLCVGGQEIEFNLHQSDSAEAIGAMVAEAVECASGGKVTARAQGVVVNLVDNGSNSIGVRQMQQQLNAELPRLKKSVKGE